MLNFCQRLHQTQRAFLPSRQSLAFWLVATQLIASTTLAATPAAVSCQIVGVPLSFETLNPALRTPQPGTGHVVVECHNPGGESQELVLTALDEADARHRLSDRWNRPAPLKLDLFVDVERQNRISSTEGSPHVVRMSATIRANTTTQFHLPFYAQVQLERLPEAGTYSQPVNMKLLYQTHPLHSRQAVAAF
jgi:spore coat protein U-like protein